MLRDMPLYGVVLAENITNNIISIIKREYEIITKKDRPTNISANHFNIAIYHSKSNLLRLSNFCCVVDLLQIEIQPNVAIQRYEHILFLLFSAIIVCNIL